MRVAVYVRQPAKPHEDVAKAIMNGVVASGEMAWVFGKDDLPRQEDADVVVIFGIGGDAKLVWDANSHARRILLDKPYARGGKPGLSRYHLVRVAIDDFQPLAYFQQFKRKPDRWFDLRIPVRPYLANHQSERSPILFDGASNKYCLWNDLPPWAEWGQQMVDKIAANEISIGRSIIYRPRPSHNPPPAIIGAELSERPINEDFARAGLVVSHGGNIGFDAVIRGIPHFAIGNSVARPLSQTDWARVGIPRIPLDETRDQWLADLAYCQWTLDEFVDGSAWKYCRETMDLIDHLKLKVKIHAAP